MTTDSIIPSMIRTVVPIIVGSVIGYLAQKGFNIDKDLAVQFTVAACIAGYYLLARVLERRWPAAGALLGSTKQPTYPPNPPSVEPPPGG